MRSIYETTNQGRQTRSHLLQHIQPGEELSREQLQQRSGLTYDQIRRQTKNLCIDGVLKSRIKGGKRWYRLCNSFIQPTRNIGVSVIVLFLAWSVPVWNLTSSNTDDDDFSPDFETVHQLS
jgi:hypothetical protein